MTAATYLVAERAEQDEYEARYQRDDPDRPYNRDVGKKADEQQNESENDHEISLDSSGRTGFQPTAVRRGRAGAAPGGTMTSIDVADSRRTLGGVVTTD
jgi:hypothetical protein